MMNLPSTPPSEPNSPNSDTPNYSAQYAVSADSYLPYSLRNCKFAPCSPNTMKNQKNKENKIDDKVAIDTNPAHNSHIADTPNASAQYYGSSDSNYPYSLINRKFSPYFTTTMKN